MVQNCSPEEKNVVSTCNVWDPHLGQNDARYSVRESTSAFTLGGSLDRSRTPPAYPEVQDVGCSVLLSIVGEGGCRREGEIGKESCEQLEFKQGN
jgi:hypothetical protein